MYSDDWRWSRRQEFWQGALPGWSTSATSLSSGGGFPQFGAHQEKALESALSNWYASDYTDNFYLKVWDPKRHDNPTYLWNSDPTIYFPPAWAMC